MDVTRWRIDAVRRDVHQRLGEKFRDSVNRALPGGIDKTFCRDASQAIELLLVSENTAIAKNFFQQLTASEREDVEFVRRARSLAQLRRPEATLKAAAGLWAEYASRCAYGMNPREQKIVERRNESANGLWKRFAVELETDKVVEDWSKVKYCTEECVHVVQGLAIGALLRFLSTSFSSSSLSNSDNSSGEESRQLSKTLTLLRKRVPKTAEQWLGILASMAEGYPLCCVVSDMSAPGAPMVYVNPEFSRVTGYTHSEACGRNCRFLQGPRTECTAVDILRTTLANREGSHVLMTNYRKNMEPFLNLLTMSPLFDSNGSYRFCVAVQFEVESATSVKACSVARRRLVRLGRFLHQIPVKLPYPSTQEATRYMMRSPCQSQLDYQKNRLGSMSSNYDGSGIALDRHVNIWITRCNWLVRNPNAIIAALLHNIADGNLSGDRRLLDIFLRDRCPDLVPRLIALISVIDIIIDAQDKMVESHLVDVPDDILCMLAILLPAFRSLAKTRKSESKGSSRATAMMMLATDIAVKKEVASSDSWAEGLFSGAPRRPLRGAASMIRTAEQSTKARLAQKASGAITTASFSEEDGQQYRVAITAVLGAILRNPNRKNALLDDLRQLRVTIVANLVDLMLNRFLSTETGVDLIELVRDSEISSSSETTSGSLKTALAHQQQSGNDLTWTNFLPSLGEAVGSSIGFIAVDMRAPGLPVTYVNQGFETVTKYEFRDAIGRNSSYLQSGKEPGHVSQGYLIEELSASVRSYCESVTKLYNFDKDGERYQVMIVLVPIYNGTQCAYTVGFQIRIQTPERLGRDIVNLDRMLRLLPRTTTCEHECSVSATKSAQILAGVPLHIAAWLSLDGVTQIDNQCISPRWTALLDAFMHSWDAEKSALLEISKQHCSIVAHGLLQFVIEVDTVTAQPNDKERRAYLRKLLIRMPRNYLFYYSPLEIELGMMDRTNFDAAYKLLKLWRDSLYPYLARLVLPVLFPFLRDSARRKGVSHTMSAREDDNTKEASIDQVARMLVLHETNDYSLKSTWPISMRDTPLPLVLAFWTKDEKVSIHNTNRACDAFARNVLGAREDAESEAVREFVSSSGLMVSAIRGAIPLTCVCPAGTHEMPLTCVLQPVACSTSEFFVVVCICGVDELRLNQDLDATSSLVGTLIRAQNFPESMQPKLQDIGYGRVARAKAENARHIRESAADTESVATFNKRTELPASRKNTLPASTWRVTPSGARAPVVVGADLDQDETRKVWNSMQQGEKCKSVLDALAKIKTGQQVKGHDDDNKNAVVVRRRDQRTLNSQPLPRRSEINAKIERLEHAFDEAQATLDAAIQRRDRDVSEMMRKHQWERDTATRTHKAEVDEIEARQLEEVQAFVDKVAELRSAEDISVNGRTKRLPCACLHSYLCIHNKNGLIVTRKKSDDISGRRHAVAAQSLVANHTKFRDGVLTRQENALGMLLEKHEAYANVLHSRHSVVVRKAEVKLEIAERELRDAYREDDELDFKLGKHHSPSKPLSPRASTAPHNVSRTAKSPSCLKLT